MEVPAFELGEAITEEQIAFFNKHGFIHFSKVASDEEVDMILEEMARMEQDFIRNDRKTVMGVPLQWGANEDGSPFLNRFAYASHYSARIREFVRSDRFHPVQRLIGDSRLAEAARMVLSS